MKPVLFVGDSHLSRLEVAARKTGSSRVVFMSAPGPIADLVSFADDQLSIIENRAFLKAHPKAGLFEFGSWLDLAMTRQKDIAATTGAELSGYSAVVLVGFKMTLHKMWLTAALEHQRGEISAQVWRKHSANLFALQRKGNNNKQFQLLKELKASGSAPLVFSVATPPQNFASGASANMLRSGEQGGEAYRLAERRFAQLLESSYGAKMVPFPRKLFAEDGLTTSQNYQHNPADFGHLNAQGSVIWLRAIRANVETELRASSQPAEVARGQV